MKIYWRDSLFLGVLFASLLLGCGNEEECNADDECGSLVCVNGQCVAPPDSGPADTGAEDVGVRDTGDDTMDAETMDVGIDASDADTPDVLVDAADDAPTPALTPAPRPAPVDFPSELGTLTVVVRTDDTLNGGTDDGQEFCLGDRCFALNVPDVDDHRRGELDVFHFEGVGLPRDGLPAPTLRARPTAEDNDAWRPACLELRYDGEPVYCTESLPRWIGTGGASGEVPSWTDPEGLHTDCTTCQRGVVTHGPMLGATFPDAARIWLRTDATRLVGLRVGLEEDLSDGVVVAWGYPRPEDDFAIELETTTLAPNTQYYYRVEIDDATDGEIIPFRTAPIAGEREDFRFAFGSCSREAEQPIFSEVLEEEPDLFLFIGDNHYANSRHASAHRFHYRRNRDIPERSAMMREVSTIATWDDHDHLENNSNGECLGNEEAHRAFGEYWANPDGAAPEGERGIYYRHSYGAVDFFVLDCRSMRPDVDDPGNRCDPDPSPPLLSLVNGPLGDTQMNWLVDEISASEAVFKMVACGSRFTPEGSRDSWASFDIARNALLDELQRQEVGGVVFLSGDIHRSELRTVPRAIGYDIPEVVSSPLATGATPCLPTDGRDRRTCLSDRSFITIDFGLAEGEERLDIRVIDDGGVVRAEWGIPRSDLE